MRDDWHSTRMSMIVSLSDPTDHDAWSTFVSRYEQSILTYCRTRFRLDQEASGEVVQRVLVKLIRSIGRFKYDPSKSFRAYLKTIASNAVRDYFREVQRLPNAGITETQIRDALNNAPSHHDDLAEVVELDLYRDMLADAETRIRPRARNPKNWEAYLATKNGESALEVATRLEMSVEAVYKAKSRIVEAIRRDIARLLQNQEAAHVSESE